MVQAFRGRDPPGLAWSQEFRVLGGMSRALQSFGSRTERGTVTVL